MNSLLRLPKNLKGCFVGSGSEGLQQQEVCDAILNLTKKIANQITVLYIGTATYDLEGPKVNQTIRFSEAGCNIVEILCNSTLNEMENNCNIADVIIISGGNTLYAVDKWNSMKLTPLLRDAMERGVVLTGGSAGAICWFDAGHSDSADPDSYRKEMLKVIDHGDESSNAPKDGEKIKNWKYLRVPCLGFIPGLVCPHFDKTQSNGVLRANDFELMLKRHPQERGICIDHFAALIFEDETYRVLSLAGRPGSVGPHGTYSAAREGIPGVWIKDIIDGNIITALVTDGRIDELIKVPIDISIDEGVDQCRLDNPI